jgi:urease accessory protein
MGEFSGHLNLRAEVRAHGRTVLASQSFRAPFHLAKPYWDADTRTLLLQVVNPTAGILAGDRLESAVSVGPGAALLLTTPSASRIFQMKTGVAESRQQLTVEAGGWLETMPEPLVPHRGSSFRQRTSIAIEPGAGLFYADILMPGRVAHGEAWAWDRLRLETEVRLGGELILRERFDQTGPDLRALADFAGSGPTACFGNVLLLAELGPDDAGWQEAVAALHTNGLWVGISALRRGGWTIKLVAADHAKLRRALRSIRQALSARFPRLACDPRKI